MDYKCSGGRCWSESCTGTTRADKIIKQFFAKPISPSPSKAICHGRLTFWSWPNKWYPLTKTAVNYNRDPTPRTVLCILRPMSESLDISQASHTTGGLSAPIIPAFREMNPSGTCSVVICHGADSSIVRGEGVWRWGLLKCLDNIYDLVISGTKYVSFWGEIPPLIDPQI